MSLTRYSSASIRYSFIVLVLLLVARLPAQTRSLGLDVSAWQGSISQNTWNNIKNVENRDFVFLRSSRGGTSGYYNQSDPQNNNGLNTLSQRYDDPYFVQNITRATNAGILAGSYHFSRPDIISSTQNSGGIANSGSDEADHFIQMAGAWMRPGYLLPVHDLEAGDGFRSDNAMAQFALDFSDRIHEVMGIRPAIYLSGNYAEFVLGGASSTLQDQVVEAYPALWSARWPNQSNPDAIPVQTAHPKDTFSQIYGPWDDPPRPTHPWSFWQYASTGRLDSYNNGNSNLDFNVAQGGIEFLKDHLVPAIWWTDSDGDWSNLANWNSGQAPVAPVQGPGQVPRVGPLTLPSVRLPGPDDTVVLERDSADVTISVTSGSHEIRKLVTREAFEITGGALTVNYVPSADSTTYSARFSSPVSVTENGSLAAQVVEVDPGETFSLSGQLTFDTLQLTSGSTPAKLAVTGDVSLEPLNNSLASIVSTAGNQGYIDLGGGTHSLEVIDGADLRDVRIDVPLLNGTFTKSGAGSLVLEATTNYQGDIDLDEGTIVIEDQFLADSADVYLTTGARFDLNFVGAPDVVNAAYIDGNSLAIGTWGAPGTTAMFTHPVFVGSGLLEVTAYDSPPSGDFNADGNWDCADINLLVTAIAFGAALPEYDMNGDGASTLEDITDATLGWLAVGGANNPGITGGNPFLVGDANLDGTVDGQDFVLWNSSKFTTSYAWCDGDFNADGTVDGQDFVLWNTNKFMSADSVAGVPEPGYAFLSMLGAVLLIRGRRER